MTTKPPAQMIDAALADFDGALPAERVTGETLSRVTTSVDWDLPFTEAEISVFRLQFEAPQSGLVLITWQVDIRHRGIDAGPPHGTQYPVGLAGRPRVRRATTQAGLSIEAFTSLGEKRGVAAGQVRDRDHHYTTIGAARVPYAVIGGLWYEFSLSLSGHTDAGSMNGVDGAVEITPNGGENVLQLEYRPGAAVSA